MLWTYFSYRRERERKSREKKRKIHFLTWEFCPDRCSVKTISCCLFGRKVEIKKESEVWTSDSADFNNGGADEGGKAFLSHLKITVFSLFYVQV